MLVSLHELNKMFLEPSSEIKKNAHFINVISSDSKLFEKCESKLKSNAYVDRSKRKGLESWIKSLMSPEYRQSILNVAKVVDCCVATNSRPLILVIGGGNIGAGTQAIYESAEIKAISMDVYPSTTVNLVGDAHHLPLKDGIIDGVIIQAVLEHVLDPIQVVSEIHRVLKPDGIVYAETPFMQHVHEAAFDFTRFTESGHRYLFRNFELIDSGVIAGAGTQLLWSIEYFTRGLFRSRKVGKAFKLLFFWLRLLDSWIPFEFNRDAASCVYFMGKSSFKGIAEKDIISFYTRACSGQRDT